MDIIVGGYIGTRDADAPTCYSSPLRLREQTGKERVERATLSRMPRATYRQEMQVSNWSSVGEDSSDNESPASALRYNLFVRNETTGETYCLIPAKTGKPESSKAGTDLQTSLSSGQNLPHQTVRRREIYRRRTDPGPVVCRKHFRTCTLKSAPG